jgi:hypothetical protein
VVPQLALWSDDGDMILSPGETWIYKASAQALDLANPPADVTVVPGCNDRRNTYKNIGRVEIAGTGVFDEDPSHYCNPLDFDSDGIPDQEDNCILVANGPLAPDAAGNSQLDTDGDGYGNICDPDLDGDSSVTILDLGLFKAAYGKAPGDPNYNPDADFDGDGAATILDLGRLKAQYGSEPGPSCCIP